MDSVYALYVKGTNNTQLSESTAQLIDGYRLGLNTGEYPSEVIALHIGITDDINLNKGKHFKTFPCQTNIEAIHTKQFFLEKRYLMDDNKDQALSGNETIIYVYS